MPATATGPQHAGGMDFDGDGVTNMTERLALTNPGNPSSCLHVTQTVRNGSNFPGTGGPGTIPIGPANTIPRCFIRIRVGP